jgi:heme/copper-type cytochrome/quinol oxidase subunit 1
MFIRFNVAFFGMHPNPASGMPRGVYTYPKVLGLGTLNMISTIDAGVFGASVLLMVIEFCCAPASSSATRWQHLERGHARMAAERHLRDTIASHRQSCYPLSDQPGIAGR